MFATLLRKKRFQLRGCVVRHALLDCLRHNSEYVSGAAMGTMRVPVACGDLGDTP